MEFCDKCGTLMIPEKKDGKPILKCGECGHEKKIGKSPKYTVEYRIKHSPKEKIVVVEGDSQRNEDISEDERRERRKAILEFFDADESE